jgi:hypothetical protein
MQKSWRTSTPEPNYQIERQPLRHCGNDFFAMTMTSRFVAAASSSSSSCPLACLISRRGLAGAAGTYTFATLSPDLGIAGAGRLDRLVDCDHCWIILAIFFHAI